MRPGLNLRTALSNVVEHSAVRTANQQASDYTRYRFHRRLICIVFVLTGLIGSPGLASAGPLIVETEDTGGGAGVVPTANQRVAARLFDEVFAQRKPDVCVLLMAATAVNHTPAGDFEGPAGFEQYVAEVWAAYPEATFAIDAGVTDGDLVTLTWTIGGQQADATGHLNGLAILRFEQHMIAESWIEYGASAPGEQVEPNVAPEICPPCREP
ncbi:MAG: nuclear transport factor 2 family protein [Thermomicrobiales bacterium]